LVESFLIFRTVACLQSF